MPNLFICTGGNGVKIIKKIPNLIVIPQITFYLSQNEDGSSLLINKLKFHYDYMQHGNGMEGNIWELYKDGKLLDRGYFYGTNAYQKENFTSDEYEINSNNVYFRLGNPNHNERGTLNVKGLFFEIKRN